MAGTPLNGAIERGSPSKRVALLGFLLMAGLSLLLHPEARATTWRFSCPEGSGSHPVVRVEANLRRGWLQSTIAEVEDLAHKTRRKVDLLTEKYNERANRNFTVERGSMGWLPLVGLEMTNFRREAAQREQMLSRLFNIITRATVFVHYMRQEEEARRRHIVEPFDFVAYLGDIQRNLETTLCHIRRVMIVLQIESDVGPPTDQATRTLERNQQLSRRHAYLRDLAIIEWLKGVLQDVKQIARDGIGSGNT